MKGGWKQGKTDTSLLMAYLSKRWGLIDKIGSNIWTFNNPDVDYIIRLATLRRWLHADKSRKVYLLDEGLKHVCARAPRAALLEGIYRDLLLAPAKAFYMTLK